MSWLLALTLVAVPSGPTSTCAVDLVEPWRAVAPEQQVVYHLELECSPASRTLWALVAGNRVVDRGELPATTTALTLQIPPLRGDLTLKLDLRLEVVDHEGVELTARTVHLFVLGNDPVAGGRGLLAEAGVALFDPAGTTVKVFTDLDIPHRRLRDAALLPSSNAALVVVGSGIDFAARPGLWSMLIKRTSRGESSLVLAPAVGLLELPQSAGWAEMRLAGAGVISELGTDLDAAGWPADGVLEASSLTLAARGDQIVGEVVDGIGGWPWLELESAAGGRLIVCSMAVVEKNDITPAARHLLARVMVDLVERRSTVKNRGGTP